MTSPLLVLDGVTKHFVARRSLLGLPTALVRAVDNVSFSVKQGETLALVGESGCGKSTVGRLALRLIEPTAGSVRFAGQDLASLSQTELRRARAGAQLIFQDPYSSLNPRMRVGEIAGRTAAVAHRPVAGGPPRPGRRAFAHGRPGAPARPTLSARVLRRSTSTHRHRPGLGAATQTDRLR